MRLDCGRIGVVGVSLFMGGERRERGKRDL